MLETALEKYANLPALAGTYNPHLLGRSSPLSADIAHMLSVSESEWQSHPVHTALLADSPQPLTAYTSRLRTLADTQPALLLAHSYVRYLGDLSGGQFIKRRIAKAYGLDVEAESGSGVEFYSFGSLEGARIGNMGDMKKVKEWFREGMDSGVGSDPVLKCEYNSFIIGTCVMLIASLSFALPPTSGTPASSHLTPYPLVLHHSRPRTGGERRIRTQHRSVQRPPSTDGHTATSGVHPHFAPITHTRCTTPRRSLDTWSVITHQPFRSTNVTHVVLIFTIITYRPA
jgi:hypothetical protein